VRGEGVRRWDMYVFCRSMRANMHFGHLLFEFSNSCEHASDIIIIIM
jgi:hypothetical protein